VDAPREIILLNRGLLFHDTSSAHHQRKERTTLLRRNDGIVTVRLQPTTGQIVRPLHA
jgi:hypothetical protein